MVRQENELRVTLRRGYVHMQAVVPLKIFTAASFFPLLQEKTLVQRPRLDITRETSSVTSSESLTRAFRCADEPMTDRGPYTLGKDGAVADVGLELPPVPPVDVVGDSGGGRRAEASVNRDSEYVRSRDCARFWRDRGFEICSLILDSSSESEPRFRASSVLRVRVAMPVPIGGSGVQ